VSSTARKEFILEGLNCANCAFKIEEQVKRLGNVESASMNFVTKILTLELGTNGNIENIVNQTTEIIKKLEPDVVVKEKVSSKLEKKVLLLIGLDCANCAGKIENEVKSIEGVKSVSVDFVSRKLAIEVSEKRDLKRIVEQASKIVVKIEPGIKVVDNEEEKEERKETGRIDKSKAIRLGLGAVLFFIAILVKVPFWVEFGMFFVSYVMVGGEVVLKAVKNILRGQVFDENFLMSVATIGAFSIKQFPEGMAVMLFYQVGEFFQSMAVNSSRKSISALMDIRPDYANLKLGEDINKVSPDEVSIGDIIIIKPGEKVPLDGKIIEGNSMLDTSAITGESVPREVEPGNEILSGTINLNGLLTVEVTKEFGDSTVSKILDLVQNANSNKAPTEQFITKFARYYTPVVVFVALGMAVIPPLVVSDATFSDWIYRALVFLVVSCPCALVISIPLGFFGGIGRASKSGILVKGSNFLEALNNVDRLFLTRQVH